MQTCQWAVSGILLLSAGHIGTDAMELATLLESEFQGAHKGLVNELYLDSLLTVFSTYLVGRYNNTPVTRPKPQLGGLSASTLRRVEDFIHANLARKLSIAEMATVAGFSPTHFARAFREATGRPPHQYVTLLRPRLAEELAKNSSLILGEIAVKTDFATHSQMTATMQQCWGTTPTERRRDFAK